MVNFDALIRPKGGQFASSSMTSLSSSAGPALELAAVIHNNNNNNRLGMDTSWNHGGSIAWASGTIIIWCRLKILSFLIVAFFSTWKFAGFVYVEKTDPTGSAALAGQNGHQEKGQGGTEHSGPFVILGRRFFLIWWHFFILTNKLWYFILVWIKAHLFNILLKRYL